MENLATYREFVTGQNAANPLRFLEFNSHAAALDYRYTHGTGGYVFLADTGGAFIFPAGMPATPVMLHPLVRGLSGKLV